MTDRNSIRRIAPNGIIETLAPADNANDSGFNSSSIVVDANENLYVNTGRTIVTYDVQGNARTFAGGGTIDAENVPATAVALLPVGDLTASPDGSIYFIDFNRVKRVTAPLPGLSSTEFLIASQDGSQAYVFDENGRHLRTIDAETGVIVYRFGYDTNGRLTTVTDADGNVTSIQRDSGGTPVALVAPGGQITTLTLGSDGYLARAANAAGEAMVLTYDSGGLLKTLTDARGGLHQFTYATDERLIKDQDPGGGFTSLARSGNLPPDAPRRH